MAVVDVANRLIGHSPRALENVQRMHSAVGAPGKVLARRFSDEEAEAKGVLDWAAHLIKDGLEPAWLLDVEKGAVSPEEICILARSRYAVRAVINELEHREVAYQFRTSGRDSFDSDPYRVLHCGMRLFANPRDLPSKRRLGRLLDVTGAALDAMEREDLCDLMRRVEDSRLRGMVKVGRVLVEAVSREWSLDDLVEHVLELDPDVDENQVEPWESDRDFFERAWNRYRGRVSADRRTLSDFLGQLSIERRDSLSGSGIRVLTVHAAKGLEFPAVALIGMNEGTFPDFRSLETEENVDDERRNAYVAVTRAERVLWLSRPATRSTQYGPKKQSPSRFLQEMGVTVTSSG